MKNNNTIIGNNKFLFLKSELEQHYNKENNKEINSFKNFNYYFKKLQNKTKDFFMFVVPDKSIICKDNLPEMYDKNNAYRLVDFIKNNVASTKFIDLHDHVVLDSSDYYMTDTHINDKGSLKIIKSIMKFFIDDIEINRIDNFLKTRTIHNFQGDLTSPLNLKNQQLIIDLNLNENIVKIENICYNNYINKIKDLDIKYRFCYSRPSKYIYNKNAVIKKKILIYGSSSTHNKVFELLSFYFENIFFYWNHLFINNELIQIFNPDIIIDIKPERFLNVNDNLYNTISNYDSNYNIEYNLLSYNDIYSILVHIDSYTFNNIIENINSLNEIKNNLKIFACILDEYRHLIKPYINLNKYDVLNLNRDLMIFYNNKTEPEISDLKLIRIVNNNEENRKYKYENIPEDFIANDYIELNADLKHMTESDAICHYEYNGYKENRKYKYENIPKDFNAKDYIKLNHDLKDMTELEATCHYEYYGYTENRYYIDIGKHNKSSIIYNSNIKSNIIIYILCPSEKYFKLSSKIYNKYPWAKPILMKYQDYTFENAFWKQLLEIEEEWINCNMVGTLSFSSYKKINLKKVHNIITNKLYLPNDFYHFFDSDVSIPSTNTNFHPYFMEIWNDALNKLNLQNVTEAYCNYWMCTPVLIKQYVEWYHNKCMPVLLENPYIFEDAHHISSNLKNHENLINIWGKPYFPHYPFIMERLVKSYFVTNKEILKLHNYKNSMNCFEDYQTKWNSYPYLFSKYILKIESPNNNIKYSIIKNFENVDLDLDVDIITHLHIYNIDLFSDFYGIYFENLYEFSPIIITYSIGIVPEFLFNKNITIINIINKGMDIGAKLCALDYIKNNNINYNYILFLHSKSDKNIRDSYFHPLIKNKERLQLIKILLSIKNNKLYGIFPDLMYKTYNYNCHKNWISNVNYINDVLNFLNIEITKEQKFVEGNCCILHKEVLDYIFKDKISIFYNILNESNSFDYNFFKNTNNLNTDLYDTYNIFNNLPQTTEVSIITGSDGMIEHAFERIWLNVIKKIGGNFLLLNSNNIITNYDVKINAIYFPQFHEIPENNNFWGDGFTEWTYLKPYPENVNINDKKYDILKPHESIGYYDLNNVNTLKIQIDIAEKYNINGFVIYHYWFENNNKILYKPLEYFLRDDVTFNFCISWANETWSRRWDGSNQEILIKQGYGNDADYLLHIQYLIPFFKRKNYIKNNKGECIFYIYNFYDIIDFYENMMIVWNNELQKNNLSIKIIITENSFKQNHNINNFNLDKFIFEPMYSTHYTDIDRKLQNFSINYNDIINNYKNNVYNTNNKHYGLPLYWNNIVRRKNLSFLIIKNFNLENMETLFNILICRILLKYVNNKNNKNNENFINVNAWNEWNEQAVLEPNNITGYENLEMIYKLTNDL